MKNRLNPHLPNSSDSDFVQRLDQRLDRIDTSQIAWVLLLGTDLERLPGHLASEYAMNVCCTDGKKAMDLPFQDDGFDLIICHDAFHQLPRWQFAVCETARVLKPGGHLLWNDIAFLGFSKLLIKQFGFKAGLYDPEDIEWQFRSSGLLLLDSKKLSCGPASYFEMFFNKPISNKCHDIPVQPRNPKRHG